MTRERQIAVFDGIFHDNPAINVLALPVRGGTMALDPS